MSWLYTIVFAGLLMSSDSDVPSIDAVSQVDPVIANVIKDEIEKFEQSYPLNPNGRVRVSNVNGSIVVEAWDRNEVRLEATKIADTKEALADVEIRVDARPDFFSVEADYDNLKRRDWKGHHKLEVQFRLSVPRTAALNEVETVNGSVSVANFVNYTKISAVNGNVTAKNLRGTANFSTVNGEVNADFDRLETGGRITLNTVNGGVHLVIPSDANATIKADSLNGEISNDFGLPVRKGEYIGRNLHGRVGTGEVQIKLSSVNGGLSIKRRNDGRSVNPATNLLPPKKNGDPDWDNEDDERGAVNAAKVQRAIAQAVRQAAQQTAASIGESERELAKMGPQLERIKLAELERLKTTIDKEQVQEMIQHSVEQQQTALARLRDISLTVPVIEKKRNSFAVKGTPRVTVEAKGCSVRVRGWDRSEVQYVVTEFAGRRNRVPVTVSENHTDSLVTLRINNTNTAGMPEIGFGKSERVRVDVFVPRKSNLKIVTDGEIRVEGVSGEVDLQGGDQSINVRDVHGKMSLSASDGQVRVIGFQGELDSCTADADVFLEGDFQKLSAKAEDGTIYLTLPDRANASVSSNTEVEAEGFQMSQENGGSWRIGRGGAKYNFSFDEGRLVVRNVDLINSR